MTLEHAHLSELRGAFRQAWDDIVADGEDEPDIAAIAAYVEGHLDDAETRRLGRHICDCPKAWEILETLLPADRPLPLPGEDDVPVDETPESAATVHLADRRPEAGRLPSRARPLALAAGWILALACGGLLWSANAALRRHVAKNADDQRQIARLEDQQRDGAWQLAQLEQGELAQTAANFRPVFAIGRTTSSLVRAADRSQSRGSGEPSKAVQNQIDRRLASVRAAVARAETQDAADGNLPLRLIEVSSLIMAGRLEDADKLLVGLESRFPGNEVRNARAVWQIASAAESKSADERTKLKTDAETALKQLATEGLPEARLNLALFYLGEGDAEAATGAATQYLRTGPDPVVAEIVRQQFGLERDGPR